MNKLVITLLKAFAVLLIANALCCCNSAPGEATISYTDSDGRTYPVVAVPGQVMISFDKIAEREELAIIRKCGGRVVEHYPTMRTYLVSTRSGKEMEFVNKARRERGVEGAHLNEVFAPMSFNMHLIDDFTPSDEIVHGEYCYIAAKSADSTNNNLIVPVRHDVEGEFDLDKIYKYVEDVFSSTPADSLILINMSFGNPILKVDSVGNELGYVEIEEKGNGLMKNKYLKSVKWHETFGDEYGEYERKWWEDRYIGFIQELAKRCISLSETNPNFIIFKSAGNDYCHVMDDSVFSKLPERLSPEELKMVKEHFLFVSAKDDDSEVPGQLYANYSNSPREYCSYMTMTDISHLSEHGTSFSTPYLLGHVARLFAKRGYRPIDDKSCRGGIQCV